MRKLIAVLMTLLLILSAIAGISGGHALPARAAAAQQPAGFVAGQWRVVVRQTVTAGAFDAFGIKQEPNKQWVIVIADVTNLGAAGAMALNSFGISAGSGQPRYFAPKTTAAVSKQLGFGGGDSVAIPENSSVRVALAFAIAPTSGVDPKALTLGLGGQALPLATTIAPAVDPAKLPALVPAMQLEVAAIQAIAGGGKIEVASQSAGTHAVTIAATSTPPKDLCYGAESAQAIMDLTGGQVWLEQDEGSDGDLVWANDAANDTFVLLNERLIEEGAGGYQDSQSAYGPWLKSLADQARRAKKGLWQTCKDTAGTYINPPTPTAAQVRASYEQIDVRDLVIRPFNYNGKKITVAGTVFNIQADESGTFIQIWVTAVDGSQQAVDIGYFGDSSGIFDGTYITVYGVGAGTIEGTNAFGGDISQPLIKADIIDH